MMQTRGTRVMVAVAALMGGTTGEAMLLVMFSGDEQTVRVNSAIAFVAVTIGCTSWLGALVTAHLRPMAVAWHLGMRTAQREAVERREHLRAVPGGDYPAV